MVYVNNLDKKAVEFEKVRDLNARGYDISCSGCGGLYRKSVDICKQCDSKLFTPTTEVIRKLELNLQ